MDAIRIFRVFCLNEKRRTRVQIRRALGFFLTLFEESDQEPILRVMDGLQEGSEIASGILVTIMYALLVERFGISYWMLALPVVVGFLRLDKIRLAELKRWINHLSRYTASFALSLMVRVAALPLVQTLLSSVTVPVFLNIVFRLFRQQSMQELGISALYLFFCSALTFLAMLLYVLGEVRFGSDEKQWNKALYRERSIVLRGHKPIKNKTRVEQLTEILFRENYLVEICRTASMFFCLLVLTICTVFYLVTNVPGPIIAIVIWGIQPIFVYYFSYAILFKHLMTQNYIEATYLINRRYTKTAVYIQALFQRSVRIFLPLVLLVPIISVFCPDNMTVLFTTLLVLVYSIGLLRMLSLRIFAFLQLDLCELSGGSVSRLQSNFFEDYVLIGLPMLTISPAILYHVQTGKLALVTGGYALLAAATYFYAVWKERRLKSASMPQYK